MCWVRCAIRRQISTSIPAGQKFVSILLFVAILVRLRSSFLIVRIDAHYVGHVELTICELTSDVARYWRLTLVSEQGEACFEVVRAPSLKALVHRVCELLEIALALLTSVEVLLFRIERYVLLLSVLSQLTQIDLLLLLLFEVVDKSRRFWE